MSVVELNEGILEAIEEHALTAEAIESVVQLSERDDVQTQQAAHAKEATDVERRIARLVEAIEGGADALSLVAKLKEWEARRTAIDIEASSLKPIPRLAPAVISSRLAQWRKLLRQSTTTGRVVLQKVLKGRITFTPRTNELTGHVDGYEYAAETKVDRLFEGIVCQRPAGLPACEAWSEGITNPFEADYGKLLDRAAKKHVKVMASPTGNAFMWRREMLWFSAPRQRWCRRPVRQTGELLQESR